MKIEFTHSEINAIMEESYSFRQKIISLMKRDVLAEYRATIRAKFPLFNGSEKVPAIKWLREDVRGKVAILREFDALNFEVYGNRAAWGDNDTLGLAASKRFVESC